MSSRRYLKGGLLLSGGSVLSAACSFARNIIIARLISVEDFGIAATFAMTMSLIEMASNLALDRLLVQAPDGDAPRMLAVAHAFQVVRGVLSAIALFLLAGPVAALFDIPEVVWAFQIIALVPLVRSFMHLDAACQQREMRFGASVWLDTVPQVLTTLAAAPLALWLGDYRVMLFVVIGQVAMMTLVSHWVAERPYRWAWDRAIIGRMLRFGWPLLINGLLMFAIFQGDKAIVGAAFSMEELGWFSAAFGLTLMPSMLIPKVMGTLFLPGLSKSIRNRDGSRLSSTVIDLFAGAAVMFAVSFWAFGPTALVVLYGNRYAAGAAVIGWLGMMQAARILKAGSVTVLVSAGRTKAVMAANSVRLIGLPVALLVVWFGGSIVAIVIVGFLAEFCSAVISLALVRATISDPIAWMRRIVMCVLLVGLAIVLYNALISGLSADPLSLFGGSIGLIVCLMTVACVALALPSTRFILRTLLQSAGQGRKSKVSHSNADTTAQVRNHA